MDGEQSVGSFKRDVRSVGGKRSPPGEAKKLAFTVITI
jgi:hypothetical protein